MTIPQENRTPEEPMGLLIVGHGTQDAVGTAQPLDLAGRVAALLAASPGKQPGSRVAANWIVEPAFLEFARPTIADAVDRLARQALRQVIACPLLLFSAEHVRRDIPEAIRQAVARHPHFPPLWMTPHLGCHRRVLELSTLRQQEAVERAENDDEYSTWGEIGTSETLLLLVGRGSRDVAATAEMGRFAEIRRRSSGGESISIGFLAMATPMVEESLALAAEGPFRRIVVQPHLLFPGRLCDRLSATVRRIAARVRDRQWIVTEPLGSSELLARAVVEIVEPSTAGSAAPAVGCL